MRVIKGFGTKVVLADFYDYKYTCINHLMQVYDTIQYVIGEFEKTLENHETPDVEEYTREQLQLAYEERKAVIDLINHIDVRVITERVAFERKELQAQINKNQEEHARLMKELREIS